ERNDKSRRQRSVEAALRRVWRIAAETELPDGTPQQAVTENVGKALCERISGEDEVETAFGNVRQKLDRQMKTCRVENEQDRPLPSLLADHATCLGKFHVQMHQQGGHEQQTDGDDGDDEFTQADRRLVVVNLRIQSQKRSAVEKK